MHKRKKNGNGATDGIHYHRSSTHHSSARYNRLEYNVESCSDSSSENDIITVAPRPGHRGNGVSSKVPVSVVVDSDTKLDSTEL